MASSNISRLVTGLVYKQRKMAVFWIWTLLYRKLSLVTHFVKKQHPNSHSLIGTCVCTLDFTVDNFQQTKKSTKLTNN